MAGDLGLGPRLRNRESTFGAWSVTASPIVVETVAAQGFEYVCFDAQHGYVTIDNLLPALHALAAFPASPMVRVPWLDTAWISKVLDAGAEGVIAPMIDTAEQARALVTACRFPPQGNRSFAATRGVTRLGGTPEAANERVAVVPMIETAEALANLDEICAVPGVDAVYIGLGDLALSLGLRPMVALQVGAHIEAIGRIGERCRAHGIGLGTHCLPGLEVQDFLDLGCTFLTTYSDLPAVRDSAAAAAAVGRQMPGRPGELVH